MSYILEALKQSQRQRQNQNQNQAQETPTSNSAATLTTSDDMDERAVRKANALWLLVACAAIAAMVIGLGLAINQSAQPQAIQQPTQQPTLQPRQQTAPSSTATSMVQPSGSETESNPSREPSVVNEVSSKAPQTTASRQSIPKAVLARVPDLNITGHIFSTQASMRRVTINGQNWVAGEWLGDDVQLHSITATGITLELEGRWRLDVSRSRGWQARK